MLAGFEKNIFLTGFMGAGKSTTGKSLANLLSCRFVDLDAEIVKREGHSISDIFSLKGEEYFRDCETDLLVNLDPVTTAVFATGGGIVQRERNRLLMREAGLIIYLNASWEVLQQRLQSSKDRPLVDPGKNWEEVRERWEYRQKYYADADYVIETDSLKPLQVAVNIKEMLEVEECQ